MEFGLFFYHLYVRKNLIVHVWLSKLTSDSSRTAKKHPTELRIDIIQLMESHKHVVCLVSFFIFKKEWLDTLFNLRLGLGVQHFSSKSSNQLKIFLRFEFGVCHAWSGSSSA